MTNTSCRMVTARRKPVRTRDSFYNLCDELANECKMLHYMADYAKDESRFAGRIALRAERLRMVAKRVRTLLVFDDVARLLPRVIAIYDKVGSCTLTPKDVMQFMIDSHRLYMIGLTQGLFVDLDERSATVVLFKSHMALLADQLS